MPDASRPPRPACIRPVQRGARLTLSLCANPLAGKRFCCIRSYWFCVVRLKPLHPTAQKGEECGHEENKAAKLGRSPLYHLCFSHGARSVEQRIELAVEMVFLAECTIGN
jgi:hypothetical protein